MNTDRISETNESYFVCSVGSFDEILYECLCENYYLLHKDARMPKAFKEIKQGDALILYYANRCVAAGTVSSREHLAETENDGWCNIVHVEKWFLYNAKNPKEGIGSYGIKWNLEPGSSNRLSVKKVTLDFGRELLFKMLGKTALKKEHENSFFIVSPKDIASWHGYVDSDPEINVGIPALQRGLVWSPQQNELLWDSLMRGIPIGSFVICSVIETQKKAESEKVTHHLLDGQQRTNAIALGFNERPREQDSIIWIDLNPSDEDFKQTTRSFLIRITTPAHPWGYRRTDESGRGFCLNSAERRNALVGQRVAESCQKPKVMEMFPLMARCPVPLFTLLKAARYSANEDEFWIAVAKQVEECSYLALPPLDKIKKIIESPESVDQRRRIYKGIKTAFSSTFVALNAPGSLFSDDTAQESLSAQSHGIAGIEHLFNRLNRQGTRLEGEELVYSMIKAYWPEVSRTIDECSDFRMPASRLLNLSIRVVLSGKKMAHNFTVSQIRGIASNPEKDSEKKEIQKFLEQDLEKVCQRIDKWFGYNKNGKPIEPWALPKILRTSVARNSPDIYLLLMWFAKNGATLDGRWVTSLIVLLHLFDARTSRSSRRWNIINTIVQHCSDNGINEEEIKVAIFESVKYGWLILPSEVDAAKFTEISFEGWETFFGENYSPMSRIIWNKDVLLYATRDFLKEKFPDYDPARKDLWAEENRPWDDDHIIPQDWINKYHGKYKKHCEQLKNSIGNFAPIPFSINRGKGKDNDWSFYEKDENEHRLYFKGGVDSLNDETYSQFAKITISRLFNLYAQIWNAEDGLNLSELTDLSDVPKVKWRKNLFNKLKKSLGDKARIYHVSGLKEIEWSGERQWHSAWMSVGIPVCKERAIACISSNGDLIECGVRKRPGDESLNKGLIEEISQGGNSGWWYTYETFDSGNFDESVLVKKIMDMVRKYC